MHSRDASGVTQNRMLNKALSASATSNQLARSSSYVKEGTSPKPSKFESQTAAQAAALTSLNQIQVGVSKTVT